MALEKPFVPTENQRDMIEMMVSTGHSIHEMCLLVDNPHTGVPCSAPMLKDVFRKELARGKAKYITAVERDVYRMALSKEVSPIKLRAAMFVLRAKGGWKETHVLDHQMPQGVIEGAHDILQSKVNRFANRAGETGVSAKSNGSGS